MKEIDCWLKIRKINNFLLIHDNCIIKHITLTQLITKFLVSLRFFLYLVHKIRVLVPQLNVVEPGKLGIRIMVWLEPRMFCAESLGKVYAKDLEISRTGWSMNFITWKSLFLWNNNLNTSVVKKRRILISKMMVRLCTGWVL